MAGTDDGEDTPLAERVPRVARRHSSDMPAGSVADDVGTDEHDLDAVTRLLGFLRGPDET